MACSLKAQCFTTAMTFSDSVRKAKIGGKGSPGAAAALDHETVSRTWTPRTYAAPNREPK